MVADLALCVEPRPIVVIGVADYHTLANVLIVDEIVVLDFVGVLVTQQTHQLIDGVDVLRVARTDDLAATILIALQEDALLIHTIDRDVVQTDADGTFHRFLVLLAILLRVELRSVDCHESGNIRFSDYFFLFFFYCL